MSDRKYHWAVSVSDPSRHLRAWKGYAGLYYVQACGRPYRGSAYAESAAVYDAYVAKNPDWYCSNCAKAARLALAAESTPKPSSRCTTSGCGSYAINPGQSGRDHSDLNLCDVCYWRKRAFDPRPISAARDDEILGYCPGIGWRRLSRVAWRRWGLTGAEHLADYEPTHFLPLLPEVL